MNYSIYRKIYQENDLEEDRVNEDFNFLNYFKKFTDFKKLITKFIQIIFTAFPIISWFRRYDFKNYLKHDIICGLTVGVLNIPQGNLIFYQDWHMRNLQISRQFQAYI